MIGTLDVKRVTLRHVENGYIVEAYRPPSPGVDPYLAAIPEMMKILTRGQVEAVEEALEPWKRGGQDPLGGLEDPLQKSLGNIADQVRPQELIRVFLTLDGAVDFARQWLEEV